MFNTREVEMQKVKTITVQAVRIIRGEARMQVVLDEGGERKTVDYRWFTKGDSDCVPEVWMTAVKSEVQVGTSGGVQNMLTGGGHR